MAALVSINSEIRLEGRLQIEVQIEGGTVVAAQVCSAPLRGASWRPVEAGIRGLPATFTCLCGSCPVPQVPVSWVAPDGVSQPRIPTHTRLLRNLVLGANYVETHLLNFYRQALLDYIDGPGLEPQEPRWQGDRRCDSHTTSTLLGHRAQALAMARKARELGVTLSGSQPADGAAADGDSTPQPVRSLLLFFKRGCAGLIDFIQATYIPDVEALAFVYEDYFDLGRSEGHLVSHGVFDLNADGSKKLLRPGRVQAGSGAVELLRVPAITGREHPSGYDQPGAAPGWLAALRCAHRSCEAGPLARLWINGEYPHGISVMDRHRARAYEALKIAQAMSQWVDQALLEPSPGVSSSIPLAAAEINLTEAPCGAPARWVEAAGGRASRFQILPATCWQAFPRDAENRRGPIEQALAGIPIRNSAQPVEVFRVLHSFDPCLACAIHAPVPQSSAGLSNYAAVSPSVLATV